MSEGERLWYTTTVLEFIVELLDILIPGKGIADLFYGRYKDIQILSPALGIVNRAKKDEMIAKYLLNPIEGAEKLKEDLQQGLYDKD